MTSNTIDMPLPNNPITNNQQVYKAFISYSHANNREQGRKWADWLHHSLETYEIPKELVGKPNQYGQPIPAQIYPIFQDEKELSANNNLSASLEDALAKSEFLIYLSSPRSAKSVYVQEEIKFFKKMGRADKIIALIVAGEPEYGETQTDNQCFPDALRYDVSPTGEILYEHHAEALAADVRLPNTSEEGFTNVEGYRRYLQSQNTPNEQVKELTESYEERLNLAKLKIISTILGVPLRELTNRDKAYQLERAKRKTKIVQRVAGAIGVLAILATGSGIYAWQQKNESQKNYSQTLYASGINKLAQNEYGDPAAYIAAAVRNGNKNATQLAESMLAIRDDMSLLPNMIPSYAKFSPSGRYIAGYADVGNNSYILQLWETDTRKKIADVNKLEDGNPREVFFDFNDNLYAMTDKGEVYRYNSSDKQKQILFKPAPSANVPITAISTTATATNANATSASVPVSSTATPSAKPKMSFGYNIKNVSPDGNWLALYSSDDKQIEIISTRNPRLKQIIKFPAGTYPTVEFPNPYQNTGSKTATTTALVYAKNSDNKKAYITSVDLTQAAPTIRTPMIETADNFYEVNLDDAGKFAMLKGGNHSFNVFDMATGKLIPLQAGENFYETFIFNPQGNDAANYTVVGLNDDGYDVYQVSTGALVSRNKSTLKRFNDYLKKPVSSFTFSPDMTQELTEKNKLMYLKNDYGNPLIINQFNFSPNYSTILPSKEGDKLYLLTKNRMQVDVADLATGKLTQKLLKFDKAISQFDVITNHRIMILDKDQKLKFFDGNSGKQIGQTLTTKAKTVAFDKDYKKVLARVNDTTVSLWQIDDGKALGSFSNPKLLNYRMDDTGKHLIFTDFKEWGMLDLTTNQVVMTGKGKLNNAVFSLDGKLMAVGSDNSEIQVYDLQSKKQKFVIPSISTPFMKFTPDSKALVASNNNRRMQFYSADSGKAYGQVISVAPDNEMLDFSADGSKLFLQDVTEDQLKPSVKIYDVATGNLISLPFATDRHSTISLVDNQRKLITTDKDMDSHTVTVWQVPTGLNIPNEQLAEDLESFYGRKYDPDTGTIMPYDGKRTFKTWFFQDIYTRSVSPDSKVSVIETIARYIPIQNEQQLKTLSSVYFYHPLARAALAEYYSRKPETLAISERLIALANLQMQRIAAKNGGTTDKSLLNATNTQIAKAKQQLAQNKNVAISMPTANSTMNTASNAISTTTINTTTPASVARTSRP